MISGILSFASSGRAKAEAKQPYTFDQDGYPFPNLYEEADEMLVVAMLMYIMTELRTMAKQKRLQHGAERILNLPTTLEAVICCIEENYDAIRQQAADHEMALQALKSIQERFQKHSASSAASSSWINPFANTTTPQHQAQLTAFGDEQPDKELVYAVAVDNCRRRITVAFRGSVTPTDFITDACIEFSTRPHPLNVDATIGLHHGFDRYLLKHNGKTTDDDDDSSCKYQEIMAQVLTLFQQRSTKADYKLYVTGHSLGGALACLFAFQAAAGRAVPWPVTCVSVASPRVGNQAFQTAFAQLEQAGALRHLRLAHAQDPVTMMPKTNSTQMLAVLSPLAMLALQARDALFASQYLYRHTGIKLRLLGQGSTFQLSYDGGTTLLLSPDNDEDDASAKKKSSWLPFSMRMMPASSGVPGVAYHYCPTYSTCLKANQAALSALTLNELYATLARKKL